MSEGLHNVVITEVKDLGKQDTQFGVQHRLAVIFEAQDQKDKEGKNVDVRLFATNSLHPKSSFIKNVLTPLGITPGTEFDTDELVGIKCQVVIQHKDKDGTTYANVTAILRNRGSKTTAPPAESF